MYVYGAELLPSDFLDKLEEKIRGSEGPFVVSGRDKLDYGTVSKHEEPALIIEGLDMTVIVTAFRVGSDLYIGFSSSSFEDEYPELQYSYQNASIEWMNRKITELLQELGVEFG